MLQGQSSPSHDYRQIPDDDSEPGPLDCPEHFDAVTNARIDLDD